MLEALRDDATLVPHLTTFDLHPSDEVRAIPYELLVDMLTERSKATQCAPLLHFTITVDVDPDETVQAQFLALTEEGMEITMAYNY